jgi:hypothetical protein
VLRGVRCDQARNDRKLSNEWARKMPTLIRPKNAVTISIIANVLSVQCRSLARCHAAQSKGFYGIPEFTDELMIYSNKVMQPRGAAGVMDVGSGAFSATGSAQ